MSSHADVERQSTQATKKQGGVSTSAMIVGGVLVGGVLIGVTAYGLGAFDSKTKTETPDKPRKTGASLKIDPKKPLSEWTPAEIDQLIKTDYSKLDGALKGRKAEAHLQAFVKALNNGQHIDPKICQDIAKADAQKNNLALTREQMSILSSLLGECKTNMLLVDPVPILSPTTVVPLNSQTDAPVIPLGSQVELKETEVVEPSNPNPVVVPPPEKPGIIDFLTTGTPTLQALFDPNNAASLEAFKTLNKLESEERKENLGKNQIAADAFEALLDDHIVDALDEQYFDDAKKQIFDFAVSKADKLQLTTSQLNNLEKCFKKPLKSALQALQEAPSGKAIDFAKTTVNKEDVEAVYKHELKSLTEKIKSKELVNGHDFLQLYDYQVKLGFSDSLKLAAEDKPALITKCSTKLDTINNPALKKAITTAGSNADKYQQIYNAYRGVADANTRNNLRAAAMDAVCSRAIIEQAASPSVNFTRNTYQALCLALFAHDLLRGDLKATGIEAGAGAVEKSTDYITTILKVLWRTPMDLLTNWDDAHVQQFTTAINTAFTNMENEIKTSTGADLEEFIGKRYAFVKNLSHFLNTMHLLYTATKDDKRKDHVQRAQVKTQALMDQFISNLSASAKSQLMAAVDQNPLSLFNSITNTSKVEELESITKWAKIAKNVSHVDITARSTLEALIKYAEYRRLSLTKMTPPFLMPKLTKKVLFVEYEAVNIDAVATALKGHPEVLAAVYDFLAAAVAQFEYVSKPADDQSVKLKKELEDRTNN